MKHFYICIMLFLLPILFFMGGTEFSVRQIPNEYKYKNDWMDQHAEEVETLILGNSHTQVGLNPAFMGDNAFNLSIVAQDYLYSHFLFFRMSKRLIRLKAVILPVSYFSFYRDTLGASSATMQELSYRIYMDCPYHKYDIAYNIEALYYKPLVGKIWKFFNNEIEEWNSDGFVPRLIVDKNPVWNADHVNKSLARIYLARSNKNVSSNYRLIACIADYCNRHGVKLFLVSTPQTKEYNGCLNRRQIRRTQDIVQKLQLRYGIKYFDYREDSRFEDDDFFDQSHLSDIGAEKFTRMFMNDIMKTK